MFAGRARSATKRELIGPRDPSRQVTEAASTIGTILQTAGTGEPTTFR